MTRENLAKSLLKIAKSDLKASKVLYKNDLYCQSIFSLQQAIEKGNKALAIHSDFLTLSSAKSVGHNQSKLIKEVLKNHLNEVEQAISVEPEFPILFQSLKECNFEFSAHHAAIEKVLSDLAWMNAETELSNLSASKLNDFLFMIESFYSDFSSLGKEKLFLGIQEYILDFLKKLNESEVTQSGDISSLIREIESDEIQIAKMLSVIIVKLLSIGISASSLTILGFLFDRMVSKVRYPEVQGNSYFNPMKTFTKRLPLVKKIPEFQYWIGRSLKELDKQL